MVNKISLQTPISIYLTVTKTNTFNDLTKNLKQLSPIAFDTNQRQGLPN